MSVALLCRRQGRGLARALGLLESRGCVERNAPSTDDNVRGSDSGACSTSGQDQHPEVSLGGFTRHHHWWPRSLQLWRGYAVNNKPSLKYVPVPEPAHDDFSAEPTTYTQLLASVRAAKSLKRLEHLVEVYADRFDAVHVAAAVARLPHLLRYREADTVDLAEAAVVLPAGMSRTRRKHGAQPRAGSAEAAARLAARLDAMLPQHVAHFFPRQAACSVWAFGELRRRGVIERMHSLPQVLMAVTRGNLQPLRVHGAGVDFAQLLHGLAKLGHDDEPLLDALLPLVEERLGGMQQRELQMSVWALAALRRATPELLEAVAQQLRSTGTAFLLPSACASVFWAYAKAEGQARLAAAAAGGEGGGARGGGGGGGGRRHARVAATRAKLFDSLAASMMAQTLLLAPQDVATTLWACSVLGYHHSQLPAVLGDALLRALPSCSDAEVASVLESLAHLGYHHAPLMDAVAASILAEPVVAAEPLNIARVLYAYGALARRGPRDLQLVGTLAEALAARLPRVQRLDTVALACRGLGAFAYDGQGVLAQVAARAEQLLQAGAPPQVEGAAGPSSPSPSPAAAAAAGPGVELQQLLPVLRCLDAGGCPHFQLAVAAARVLDDRLRAGGGGGGGVRSAGQAVEVLYYCARQGVEDKEAAKAVLEKAVQHAAELRAADVARLVVCCQVMGQPTAQLDGLLPKLINNAASVDAATARAAATSAAALGLADVAQALQAASEPPAIATA
ncbi:hypothetical protein HYH02_010615 [Chlamydomonas schloesseri]|uniref:Uncharacterized protein n=1 Tax=Chlamydomonas schloesseri TaxID=2026947 RepID=A0A835W718_9CHLO|nr:hypothetical protein HYH02_010615 [Chlamydomonas schloesseri]|eukprot:KAG2439738.1 hypothetical protein HYH02_010615 [Chlamydomonas schloesseri]